MATLRMALNIPSLATNNAKSGFEIGPTNRQGEVLTKVAAIMEAIAGGGHRSYLSGQAAPSLVLSIDQNTTAASGTVTCVTVANNSTVTIGNQTLTGKTAAPSGQNQFLCGVSATADALALKNCINAHSTLSQYMLATSALGVVTITMIGPALGVIGNQFKLTSSDGTNLAVVAFASGADDSTAKTFSF
jgi:hypothetical protein